MNLRRARQPLLRLAPTFRTDRLACDLNPRPFNDETTPGQHARAGAPYASTTPAFRTTVQRREGQGQPKASGRVQGWTLRPKELPQATYRHADRTESGEGRGRPKPRPQVTRVFERKCQVQERQAAAHLGFLGRAHPQRQAHRAQDAQSGLLVQPSAVSWHAASAAARRPSDAGSPSSSCTSRAAASG